MQNRLYSDQLGTTTGGGGGGLEMTLQVYCTIGSIECYVIFLCI